ncbi:unnamed protein product [Parnassius mnemosyne]|uniref:HTH cro/C1-type domain-containing protein n=2 Tax=Parnassius mnemosyne TaxID=213953 RepID=A0AAV1L5S6_9NEOP
MAAARREYTQREYAEMHYLYGFCDGNARAAAREYRQRYPSRDRFSDYRVFMRVHNSYTEGVLPGQHAPRAGRPAVRFENGNEVLRELRLDPGISQRQISRNLGITRSTVQQIIKRKKYHAYHVQRVQALAPGDYEPRVRFCREMLRYHREDPQFFNKVLWTDESNFRRMGVFNIHNLHFYSRVNPHIIRNDRFQHLFGINMWAGIIGQQLVLHEMPARLNGALYLNFLQNNLNRILNEAEVPEARIAEMWLQHDGAPPHYARAVRDHLNERFPNRWIGRGGPIAWPPRSPDLNPLDFFLWGYFKEIVYQGENNSEQELRQKLEFARVQVINNRGAFRRLRRNFIRRCRLCVMVRGRNFEHLL